MSIGDKSMKRKTAATAALDLIVILPLRIDASQQARKNPKSAEEEQNEGSTEETSIYAAEAKESEGGR